MTKVTVSGNGKAQGSPDVALIEVRIENEEKTAQECRRLNNAGSEQVVTIANAKSRAETYAEEIALPITGVETIEEHLHYGNRGARHPSGKFAAMAAMEDGPDEILEMGDIEVNVNVNVCFKLGE